ncbi:GRAM domain protein [Bernardetia litoralis DSM 6794]|uniref:GRAM domain protein n=1 Tax=Bernardetia litoralis (strain ATCC 23117 / DSM 6794 / NBRC 15988 / NCIMB 1366 / Fx l1 / Sio-4) TaxID=880071 RepID=I4AKE6_BERLS|nr:GRAM domain-containing protein [Bernardetia litoralis]AFM04431.1 GRAM domain protein [Bernardetia litoralis DSM 6794]
MAFQLPKNEILQGKWTFHYLSPAQNKYNGVLYLTKKNLYFQGNFQIENLSVSAIEGGFVIPLEDINAMASQKDMLLFNQLHIQMKDKEVHIFDRGVLPVGGVIKQINEYKNK